MADDVNKKGILKLEVDQQDGITELENLKNVIVGLKLEQAQLNKDFRAGTITQKEYAQESVRVENILKKTNIAYNEQQRAILGVKSWTEKLAEELKKRTTPTMAEFRQQVSETAKGMTVAGVNIGSVTNSLKMFLSPGAAAVGILGALVAGYAASARGAKDLQLATDQLSAAFRIATDSYGEFVAELSESQERGLIDRFIEGFNRAVFGDATANRARAIALALEELRKFEIQLANTASARKLFEKAAEDGRRVRDNELESIENRLNAIDKVEQNINAAGDVRIIALKAQKELIKDASTNYKYDIQAQTEIAKINAEISDIQEEINGKLTENIKARQTILKLSQDLKASQATGLAGGTKGSAVQDSISAVTTPDVVLDANIDIETYQTLNQATAELDKQRTASEKKQAAERYNNQKIYNQLSLESALAAASMISGGVAALMKEGSDAQKVFTLLSIGADTAEAIAALTAASEQNPANSTTFGGAAVLQYAAGLARILGNVATAKSFLSQAAGGGDFMTKGPALLMVGDNPGGVERVTVEPISGKGQTKIMSPNLLAMAGGGSLTSMPDGGMVTNGFINQSSGNAMLSQMMERMERMEMFVSIVEFRNEEKRLKAKERRAKGKRNVA